MIRQSEAATSLFTRLTGAPYDLFRVVGFDAARFQSRAQFGEMLMVSRLDRAKDVHSRNIGAGEGAVVHHLFDARASGGDLRGEISEPARTIADDGSKSAEPTIGHQAALEDAASNAFTPTCGIARPSANVGRSAIFISRRQLPSVNESFSNVYADRKRADAYARSTVAAPLARPRARNTVFFAMESLRRGRPSWPAMLVLLGLVVVMCFLGRDIMQLGR
jgi:hypothetical protein